MTDNELLQLIRESFPPHPLDPDRAFHPAGGAYLNIDEFRRDSQGITWERLELKFLRFHYDALQQLSPSGFADYLPAFLAIMVKDRPNVDIIPSAVLAAVTRSPNPKITARYEERMGALTDQQNMVLMKVIEHLKVMETDELDKERMGNALQEIGTHVKERMK